MNKKRTVRIAKMMLAIILVVTMFGTGSLDVKAVESYDFYISPSTSGGSGTIDLMDESRSWQEGIASGSLPAGKWICVEPGLAVAFKDASCDQDSWSDIGAGPGAASEPCYKFSSDVRFEVSGTTVTFIGSESSKPCDTENNESSSSKTSTEPKHEHNYKWEVAREASESFPGERVYKCDCGSIAEREVIPVETKVMERINNTLDNQVKSIPTGGKVTLELGNWNSLKNSFMNKIQDSGASVTLKYNYKNKKYTIVIPANGFKDMGVEWYGPAFLYSIYGGTIED